MTTTLLTLFVRFMRVGIALVTVWCLGCGAFEPLVSSLLGMGSSRMSCGSDLNAGSIAYHRAPTANERPGPEHGQTVGAMEQGEAGNYSCACESCYSSSPVTISLELQSLVTPEAIPTTPSFPESVNRVPLLPPPQFFS